MGGQFAGLYSAGITFTNKNIVTTLGLLARKSTLPHEHAFAAQLIARRTSGSNVEGMRPAPCLFHYNIVKKSRMSTCEENAAVAVFKVFLPFCFIAANRTNKY